MEVIKKMEEYAKEHNVPIMQPEGMQFLKEYIKTHDVKRILELGSAIGYSAIQMCLVDANVEVVTIERDEVRYEEAVKNIKEAGLEDRITLVKGDALEWECEGVFDLLFIDAAKAQYIKFFERYEKNVKKNGVIVSDNLAFHGMVNHSEQIANRNTRQLVRKIEKFIAYLKEHPVYETTFYDVGDGIALSKRKDNV